MIDVIVSKNMSVGDYFWPPWVSQSLHFVSLRSLHRFMPRRTGVVFKKLSLRAKRFSRVYSPQLGNQLNRRMLFFRRKHGSRGAP